MIDTFITVVSNTMMNWAVARIAATPQPTFTAAGADPTRLLLAPSLATDDTLYASTR